ncbi:hypothetical protein [Evansella halocellulosilytica]|uniref:hypothetical protein n=1 Tax=Evansella halocellulosilytica TaxID=2011013 RepID=UPI000BB8D0C1|nr:hypothetical protein [Evansella halocellulosilytica]
MYKFDVDKTNKKMVVTVGGMFTSDEGAQYIEDFKKEVAGISANEYSLVLDGKELKVSSAEIVDMLNQAVQMYFETGFKKIYLVKLDSAVAMMQIKRIPSFIDKVTLIDSVADAS